MMKNNILYKEEQLNRGIPEYLLGQKRLFTGFCESRSFRETANNGNSQKKGLDMTYAGIINLKKLKKATTTLKYTDTVSKNFNSLTSFTYPFKITTKISFRIFRVKRLIFLTSLSGR